MTIREENADLDDIVAVLGHQRSVQYRDSCDFGRKSRFPVDNSQAFAAVRTSPLADGISRLSGRVAIMGVLDNSCNKSRRS